VIFIVDKKRCITFKSDLSVCGLFKSRFDMIAIGGTTEEYY